MKNHKAAAFAAISKIYSALKGITIASAVLAFFFYAETSHGDVKFSKPVVLMKGTVHAAETGKVYSVKVSIRSAENADEEITSSVSNSETGNYLVVLSPNTKYLVRLQSAAGVMKEETIKTPTADQNTVQLNKDFTIKATSSKEDMGNLVK